MLGLPDGLLVVLHHDHCVPLLLEAPQGIEQHPVVAGVQADGGLVEDVAHAAQVGAERGGEADALRLAAAQGRCGAVEGEVPQSDLAQEVQARAEFAPDVARDRLLPGTELQAAQEADRAFYREGGEVGDAQAPEAHRQRLGAQAVSAAAPARDVLRLPPLVPPAFLAGLLLVESRELEPGAVALPAPAVLGVEGEQARVRLREAAPAARAGAAGGKDALGSAALACHLDQAPAEVQGAGEHFPQLPFPGGADLHLARGELDVVLPEAVEARPHIGRQPFPVHPQVGEALARCPLREVGVVALAGDHQRG